MPWTCNNCQTAIDDAHVQCWQCGTGVNGEPPPADWRPETSPQFDGSEHALACLRCAHPMTHAGRQYIQSGAYAKEALLGEFMLERVSLDMYRCEGCGKVEFFAVT
jgi:predicted amidophosphoribosyltransferase